MFTFLLDYLILFYCIFYFKGDQGIMVVNQNKHLVQLDEHNYMHDSLSGAFRTEGIGHWKRIIRSSLKFSSTAYYRKEICVWDLMKLFSAGLAYRSLA